MGQRWAPGPDGPYTVFRHRCGELTAPGPICSACGAVVAVEDLTPEPGPAYHDDPGHPIRRAGARRAAGHGA